MSDTHTMLVKVANKLDNCGLYKEADAITELMIHLANTQTDMRKVDASFHNWWDEHVAEPWDEYKLDHPSLVSLVQHLIAGGAVAGLGAAPHIDMLANSVGLTNAPEHVAVGTGMGALGWLVKEIGDNARRNKERNMGRYKGDWD